MTNNKLVNSKPKKILQIRKGEYLLDILTSGSINTTYNIDVAMDIRNWSLEQLGSMIDNLKRVGYTKAKILTIEEVAKEITEIAENTFETANKIGKALKEVKERVESNEV